MGSAMATGIKDHNGLPTNFEELGSSSGRRTSGILNYQKTA